MSKKYTKNTLNALSDLVGLNVYIMEESRLLFCYDQATTSAFTILAGTIHSLLPYVQVSKPAEYEIVENSYRERYIIFVLPDKTLLILGPFLLKPSDATEIRSILRELQVPLEKSGELLEHHRTLPVHSRRFCQSLLALLEQMFPAKGTPPAIEAPIQGKGPVISRYYRKTVAEDRMKYRVRSPIALENKLLSYIERGDWPNAKETLEDINSLDTAVFTADPVQSKRYSLVAGCTLYTRANIQAGINYMTAFSLSDAMIRTIHTTNTLEELVAFEYEMLELFCSTVATQTKGKYSLPVYKAMEYISVNLTSPISLKDLGQYVELHPNYLSNLFRKEVGITVSKYIQQLRIEESKQLLLGTNETMAAIGNYYQFCNEAYYIRVFREHQGITPAQYRKENLHVRADA